MFNDMSVVKSAKIPNIPPFPLGKRDIDERAVQEDFVIKCYFVVKIMNTIEDFNRFENFLFFRRSCCYTS
jgi:hypothetical protein